LSEIYCLDSNVLITHFKKEPNFEKVGDLFERAEAGEITLKISVANVIEVLYDLKRTCPSIEMTDILKDILSLPVTIVHETTDNVILEAARLKHTYHIALGDVFGLAVAKELGAAFVTSDHAEMEQVEKHEPISFLWLPANPPKK